MIGHPPPTRQIFAARDIKSFLREVAFQLFPDFDACCFANNHENDGPKYTNDDETPRFRSVGPAHRHPWRLFLRGEAIFSV